MIPTHSPLRNAARRATAIVLAIFLLQAPAIFAQIAGISASKAGAPMALQIVILEGEDALNNIRQRTAREPIVQVQDENHKPVAGAVVLFTIKRGAKGASASFGGGATLAAVTGLDGIAVAKGLTPNALKGAFTINVQASVASVTASAVITQTNVISAATTASASSQAAIGAAHHVGLFGAHFWIVAGTIAAASGAIVTTLVVTHQNGATISVGNGTVKP